MPYYKRKEKCTNKSGKKGTFVTIKKNGGKRQCWKSEQAFKRSTAARHANEADESQDLIELANEGRNMIRLTRRQLRRIIQEAVNEPIASINTLGSGTIDAVWTPDGLAMELHVNGKPAISLGRQKDAVALINMLEELLAGPMRTSP